MENNSQENSNISFRQKIGFCFGHIFNDMCSSMWFTYLIAYMSGVIEQNHLQSGILLFFGQFSDALATPFIGIESDKIAPKRYGKRKVWHLAGSVAVLISFPFIFNRFPGVPETVAIGPNWGTFFYYMVLVMIFQAGWAAVQLAHMALIPDITYSSNQRVLLNNMRYFCTVMSNVFVFVVNYILFYVFARQSDKLEPADSKIFNITVIIICVVGSVFTFLFHILLREGPGHKVITSQRSAKYIENESDVCAAKSNSSQECDSTTQPTTPLKFWVEKLQFYQVILCYMLTRVIVNVTQVYINLYVLEYAHLKKTMISLIPLLVFIGGLFPIPFIPCLIRRIGTKFTIMGAVMFNAGNSIWLMLLNAQKMSYASILGNIITNSVLLGLIGSILLVSTQHQVNELIGRRVDSSAFVIGLMSFGDKMLNGIVVLLLEAFVPTCSTNCIECNATRPSDSCKTKAGIYYKYIMSGVPLACSFVVFCLVLSLLKTKVGVFETDLSISNDHTSNISNSGDTDRLTY